MRQVDAQWDVSKMLPRSETRRNVHVAVLEARLSTEGSFDKESS
jgi:hypothetical protein